LSEEQGNDFESLFPEEPQELKTAVGTQEHLLRTALGNDRYEAMLKYEDASAHSVLSTNVAIANRINGLANLYNTIAASLPILFLIGAAWSIFFWVIWALH
jgi:hypothetical protein